MKKYYLGMLSGTSMDGVDIGLFDFTTDYQFIAGKTFPYPDSTYQALITLIQKDDIHDPMVVQLDQQLGQLFANRVNEFLSENNITAADIIAIGSHGQNISHHPEATPPHTCQIGAGDIIAKDTGITTVCNFREADIHAGGQGAPLSPLLHQALFSPHAPCAVVNIGGIANVSIIQPEIIPYGFDTGPGNALMDAWIAKHQAKHYDHDGAWAASGNVDHNLLQKLLQDPYFKRPHPKSTGKEYFNLQWLAKYTPALAPEDMQATLLELTAQSITTELNKLKTLKRVYICGGGVHNRLLMQRLHELSLEEQVIDSTEKININPDYLEAMLFAWLAQQRLAEDKLDTKKITGAQSPVLLGDIFN